MRVFAALAALLFATSAVAQSVSSTGTSTTNGSIKVTVNQPPNDILAGPTALTSPGTVTVNSQGSGSVGVQATGTGTGLAFTFQGTVDGTNYASIQCFPTSTNAVAVSTGSANGAWQCPTAGLTQVRVNLTAISGGTETFTVNSSAGSANGVNATLSAPANDVAAGPSSFTGAGTLAVNSQGSGSVGLVVTGTYTGAAWTLQGSVDGTNYVAIPFYNNTAGGTIYTAQPGSTNTTGNGTYVAPAAGYRSVRINVTALSTGTLTASLNASAGSAQRPVGVQGDNSNINGINGNAIGDPCFLQAKTNIAIATSSGNTQLVAGVSAKKIYICSFHIVGAAAYVFNLIEGTGASCTTANEAAIWGSTTAANGDSLPANGGMTYGNGEGVIGQTATAANGVCLLQNGTVALSGNMTVVQQ